MHQIIVQIIRDGLLISFSVPGITQRRFSEATVTECREALVLSLILTDMRSPMAGLLSETLHERPSLTVSDGTTLLLRNSCVH
ncbi:MAG: hypothetical protein ACFB02_07675 [Mastigocoleus sp.]